MLKGKTGNSLKSTTVLVTRPKHQADSLCHAIESLDGGVVRFPTIDIKACSTLPSLQRQAWDLVLWTSANAVNYCPKAWIDLFLNQSMSHIPIGPATNRALRAKNLHSHFVPKAGTTSESLIEALKQRFSLEGSSSLIIKGQGGRQAVIEGLTSLGCDVDCLEVYRRCLPVRNEESRLHHWLSSKYPIAVAASSESLHNLIQLFPDNALPILLQSPLVVVSERTKEEASSLGFISVVAANSASDQDLIECLLHLEQSC